MAMALFTWVILTKRKSSIYLECKSGKMELNILVNGIQAVPKDKVYSIMLTETYLWDRSSTSKLMVKENTFKLMERFTMASGLTIFNMARVKNKCLMEATLKVSL
jgi:hypothetical protein